jgi:hypothetical protein
LKEFLLTEHHCEPLWPSQTGTLFLGSGVQALTKTWGLGWRRNIKENHNIFARSASRSPAMYWKNYNFSGNVFYFMLSTNQKILSSKLISSDT